ncbi:riboflavin biosynthesis protein RibT [Leuconostocaceae bacterium ESL0723]|nr:riboflavin biosynthesis protein RibT [Leuconostocaceae bacterium ESL0723]
MLRIARHDDEKTVMGILSLWPGLKEISHLRSELNDYRQYAGKRQLFVWQRRGENQVQGVLGVEFYQEDLAVIRHIVLTPAVRQPKFYYNMLGEFQEQYPNCFIMGTIETQNIINQWRKFQS